MKQGQDCTILSREGCKQGLDPGIRKAYGWFGLFCKDSEFMGFSGPGQENAQFLILHIPALFKRFTLSYERDCSCVEYFLYSKEKNKQISKTLMVSHEQFSSSLYVSKFYPEIYRELHCKYLSAACFYMMAHHAVNLFHLADNCSVNLETDVTVFDRFYSRLNDFNFKIHYNRVSERVCLKGHYHALPFRTDMITLQLH